MAQRKVVAKAPAPLVQVRTLKPAVVRRYLTSPVETRRGKITGITITVPLLRGRNKYLVLKVPPAKVKELLEYLSRLPKGERAGLIKDWAIKNQESMLKQYIEAGRKPRFRFKLVPMSSVITPELAELRRKVEMVPKKTPRLEAGIRVERLPGEIRGGKGTKDNPYIVHLRKGQQKKYPGGLKIKGPLVFEVEGLGKIYFKLFLTVSQLGKRSRKNTAKELSRILREGLVYHAEQRGFIERKAIRGHTEPGPIEKSLAGLAKKIADRLRKTNRAEAAAEVMKYVRSH